MPISVGDGRTQETNICQDYWTESGYARVNYLYCRGVETGADPRPSIQLLVASFPIISYSKYCRRIRKHPADIEDTSMVRSLNWLSGFANRRFKDTTTGLDDIKRILRRASYGILSYDIYSSQAPREADPACLRAVQQLVAERWLNQAAASQSLEEAASQAHGDASR